MIPLEPVSPAVAFVRAELGNQFPHINELATALDCFSRDDSTCDEARLALLLARMLLKNGDRANAERVLSRHWGEKSMARILDQKDLPARAVAGLQARILRPDHWTAGRGEVVWVLDLTRLKGSAADSLELVVFPALRSLLEETAAVWQESSGDGTLAIRGLNRQVIDSQAVLDFCRAWMEHERAARAWTHTPELLVLDGLS